MSSHLDARTDPHWMSHAPERAPAASPAASPPGPTPSALRTLAPIGGPSVDARACVEPGTTRALVFAALVGLALTGFLVLTVTGALVALAVWLVQLAGAKRARTILRASSLRVGPRQLPEIHACVSDYAARLGLAGVPETYVYAAAEMNAFALRFGRKNGIALTDEAVAAALEGRSPGALAFVIGHELGHIALGHHRAWRSALRRFLSLSRKDELSADRVACELVGSLEAAESGVISLLSGPRLLALVDRAAARAQAEEQRGDRALRRVERTLTHPLALRRLERVHEHFQGRSALRAAA